MTRFAESYAVWLADYYLLATVLLALALAAAALFKQPAQRLMVTKSTFVALLLLGLLCALPGWSVIHLLAADQSPTPAVSVQEEPVEHLDIVNRPYLTQSNTVTRPEPSAAVSQPANIELPEPIKPKTKVSWPALLATAHLAGMACIVAWLTLGWAASLRLRRSAQPAPANVVAILNGLTAINGPQPNASQLFTHDRLDVAVALGVFRPLILLPERWTKTQSHERLRAVLAHESTHILNHDLQWVAAARTLLIVLWANPPFWLIKRRLRLDQEALADAAAAEISSRQEYAEQLVAWARNVSSRSALHLSSAVGLWEAPSQLRQRIAILLDEQLTVIRNCSRRWRVATALTLIACAAILSLVTIQPAPSRAAAKEAKPNEADPPAAPKTGALAMRFEYDGVPPVPTELKEYILRAKLDNRELGRIDVEKEIGAKVFDESLLVGKDGGIANVLVWVISKDFPRVEPGDKSPPKRWDEKQKAYVPLEYKGPPPTITYQKGKYEPRVTAFEWPRQVVVRNDDPKSTNFNYLGTAQLQDTWRLLLKPGEERKVDVHPARRIPGQLSVMSRVKEFKAWVLPCDNPFFAVSDAQGRIQINDLPPGKWEFQVWHERSGYLKTAKWPRGRFTLEIKPGENDLGTIKISPEALKVGADARQPSAEQPKATLIPAATEPQAYEEGPDADSPRDPLFELYRKHFKQPEPNVLAGIVVDEKFQPLAQAKVSLYRFNLRDSTQKLIAEKSTDADGKVRFDKVLDLPKEFPGGKLPPLADIGDELLQVTVRTPGRVTHSHLQARQMIAIRGDAIMAMMPPGVALRGRVTSPDAKPVAGALVSVAANGFGSSATGMSARTNADGDYAINDVPPFDRKSSEKEEEARRNGKDAAMNTFRASPSFLTIKVEHPDFAVAQGQIEKTPGTVDVQLQPAAILVGRVVFGDSGKPAGGARIVLAGHDQWLTGTKQTDDEQRRFVPPFYTASVRADANGNYRLASLPTGYYHLTADLPGWVNAGLRDIEATSGKTNTAPDLTLTKGGTVSIRLVDAKTHEPIQVPPEAEALIGNNERPIYDRPPTQRMIPPTKNGLFELQLPAGKHEIYIGGVYVGQVTKWMSDYSTATESPNAFVTVTDSQTVQIDMPVVDAKTAKVVGADIIETLPKLPKLPPRREKDPGKAPNDQSKTGTGGVPTVDSTSNTTEQSPAELYRIVGSVYGKNITASDIGLTGPIDTTLKFDTRDQPHWKQMLRIVKTFGQPTQDHFEKQTAGAALEETQEFNHRVSDTRKQQLQEGRKRREKVKTELASKTLSESQRAHLLHEQSQLEMRRRYEEAEQKGDLVFNDDGVRHLFYYYFDEPWSFPNWKSTDDERAATRPPLKSARDRGPNTIIGRVADEKYQPLVGAEVLLVRINQRDGTRKLVAKKVTDANGQYQFDNVIDVDKEFPGRKFPGSYEVGDEMLGEIVRAPGRITSAPLLMPQEVAKNGDYHGVIMFPAATLRGRVTDASGKPVAGALVSIDNGPNAPWEGVQASRSDANGNYKIEDAAPFDEAEFRKQVADQERQRKAEEAGGTPTYRMFVRQPILRVDHPDFAVKRTTVDKSPGNKDVQLQPAAVLEGHVVFADSGKPASGVLVGIVTSVETHDPPIAPALTDQHQLYVRTDADGKYRAGALPPGKYELWAETPDWVNVSTNDVVATAGKASAVPDLKFTKGGTVSARIVDAKSREPIPLPKDARAMMLAWSASERPSLRPNDAPFITINSHGRFDVHLPPGKRKLGAGGVEVGGDMKYSGQPTVEASVAEGKTTEVDLPVELLQPPSTPNARPKQGSSSGNRKKQGSLQNGAQIQLVQNTTPVAEKPEVKRPPGILGYGDDKPDGKKSLGGSGEMIQFELPKGVTKIKGIRIHGSRYGVPQAPKEDFEITFLNEKRDETLHSEAGPYRLFNRGKEQWVRVAFKNEVELPPKFWVCLNFNAAATKGVYVSYDTSTKGKYSRVGLPGDSEEPKETDFKGDWMVQLILAKPEK